MDWLLNNPIATMYGPHFLVLYGLVILVTLAGCWWACREPRADSLPPVPSKPDPYEIAYLRGGEAEVTKLIALDLIQRGYLETGAGDRQLGQAGNAPDARHLTQIERQVFDRLKTPLDVESLATDASLGTAIASHAAPYEQRLQGESLITTRTQKDSVRQARIFGALLIGGLGGYKLYAALSSGHSNVLFLIIMGLSSAVLTVWLVWSTEWPPWHGYAWFASALSGLLNLVALFFLYRALARGPVAVASPAASSFTVLLVALNMFAGEAWSGWQLVAMLLVFAGVAMFLRVFVKKRAKPAQ